MKGQTVEISVISFPDTSDKALSHMLVSWPPFSAV